MAEMDQSPTKTGQPEQDELLSSGHFQMPFSLVRDGEGGGVHFVERRTTATAMHANIQNFNNDRRCYSVCLLPSNGYYQEAKWCRLCV